MANNPVVAFFFSDEDSVLSSCFGVVTNGLRIGDAETEVSMALCEDWYIFLLSRQSITVIVWIVDVKLP